MAIAGLVLSIIGIVLSFLGGVSAGICSIVALPVAIVGLVLSCIARKKQPGGIATAGMVVGIVAVSLSAILFFTCGICTLCALGTIGAGSGLLL